MRTPRDQLALGLFTLLQQINTGSTPLTIMDRSVVHWSQAEDLPAMYLQQFDDDPNVHHLNLMSWRLNFMCWIYLATEQGAAITADPLINRYKDQLEFVIQGPTPGYPQTLNGLADQVYISGTIKTLPGRPNPPAVIAAPIVVLCGV